MKAGGYREIGKGSYEFRVRVKDPLSGESVRRSHTWHGTKREVGGALAKWVADEMNKVKLEPTDLTLSLVVAKWIDMQAATLSPATIRTYQSYAKQWIDPGVGKLPVEDVKAGHLRDLHAKMAGAGKSTSTTRQVHAIIRGALTYAMEHEWTDRNVAAMRTAPKLAQTDVVACTDAELWDLLQGTEEPGCDLWAAVALGATLGRRLGQLCDIRRSDIDLDGGSVRMRPSLKSPHAIAIPIDHETADVLKTRLEWQEARWERIYAGPHSRKLIEDPYLLSFVSDGSAPKPESYTASFTRLRKRLHYDHLHFHCLRHYCATTLINAGVPLPVVAERLGHSSPAVTARIYAHVVAGRHDEAAGIIGRLYRLATGQRE